MYLFLHTVKGTPFETPDQGKARLLTHWEQMDYGVQFTSSRKFLTISPIVLWVLTWSLVISTQPLLKQSYILISRHYIDFLYKPALCGLLACSSGSGVHAMWKQHVDGIIWKLLVPLALAILHKFSKTLTTSLSLCRYILASFYTKYDPTHFLVNTCSLLSVLLPKLPQFHGVRIFGINKYWQNWLNTGAFPLSLTC